MKTLPYRRFEDDQLTLRDALALDRTFMANQRTLLGFLRTSLTLLLAGVSLLKLFALEELHILGWGLLVLALPVAVFGIYHYFRVHSALGPLITEDEE